ncbi:MAG: HEAT repeat domain-containing protein, partial [Verrucomicrobiota bacterium]
MKDIELWELLRRDHPDPRELARLLNELAGQTLRKRFPYMGLLDRALGHGKVEVRAAAVRCLAGAHGFLAFRAMIDALRSPSFMVQTAAVDALLASAAVDPGRVVHAVFHKSLRVRRYVLEQRPDLFGMALYLLPDEDCRAQILEHLEPAYVPTAAFSLVLQFYQNGVVERDTARNIISSMNLGGVFSQLFSQHMTTWPSLKKIQHAMVVTADEDAIQSWAATFDFGWIDLLVELFWDDGETGSELSRTFYTRLIEWNRNPPPETLSAIFAMAIIKRAVRLDQWKAYPVHLCAVLYPITDAGHFLCMNWIPKAVRRRGIALHYQWRSRLPKVHERTVSKAIKASDLTWKSTGWLDVYSIGGMLCWLDKAPYMRLQKWFPPEQIIESCLKNL